MPVPRRPVRASLSAALAAASLAGCGDLREAARLSPGGVDRTSPIAPQVVTAAARSYKYPKFRDVPARPTDIRPATAWKSAVVDEVGERRTLRGWIAANPQLGPSDTDAFLAAGKAAFPPDAIKPLDAGETSAATEAYAAALRAQTAPPPPPK